ncbi:MAG: Tn7 transposase TnsA N-terminal domain-containing protein [Comamonas sp.]|nr:Tn7 transposase TnsA N-terminal domain-containing protein [Comamonas sp.]
MLLLQFDPTVDVYTPQPLTVGYRGIDGNMHRYTPDGLIEWRSDPRPTLVEIKYREAFRGDWRRWRCLTRALVNFAEHRGWRFAIFTEQEIRTPFLENVRFLLPYKQRFSTPETEEWILN